MNIYIYIYIYVYILGGACSVTVTAIRNGHDGSSLNPGRSCLPFT